MGRLSEGGPAPCRLLLLRHGEAEVPKDRYPDHLTMPLSAVGRQQAAKVASELAGASIDRIVSSPLRRAEQTAEAVAAALGLLVELDGRLRERVFPPLYGRRYDDIEADLGADIRRGLQEGDSDRLTLADCESLPECRRRVRAFLQELAASGGTVLAACHGGPHEWIVGHLLAVGVEGRWSRLGHGRLSLVELRRDGSLDRLGALNVSARDARQLLRTAKRAAGR